MYDELVESLRDKAEFLDKTSYGRNLHNSFADAMKQAADAIETLSKLAQDEHNRAAVAAWERRWIPVNEKMPESGVCVLVTDGLEVGEGRIAEFISTKGHFSRWCCPTADIDVDRRLITHWMPLPKGPEEEK